MGSEEGEGAARVGSARPLREVGQLLAGLGCRGELGGEAHTLAEVAAVIGETIGQEVAYTDVPVEQLQQVLAGAGVPAPMDAVLADVDRGIAAGELLVPTTDLERLLGRPATDLRQAVKEALA